MEEDPSLPGQYLLYRMVPPGPLGYFYSNEEKNTYVDPVMPAKMNKNQQLQTENINIVVPKINYVENAENLAKYLSADDLLSFKALPRPEPKYEPEPPRPKTPWTLEKSIFATYKYDTDEHLAHCFDFDWKCSKIEKMIKSVKDKENIYKYLKSNYRCM